MKMPSTCLKISSDGPNRIIYTDFTSDYVFDMLMVHDFKNKMHLKAFKMEECRPQNDPITGLSIPSRGFGLQRHLFVLQLDLICEDLMSVIIQDKESRWQRVPEDMKIDKIPKKNFRTS